MVSALSLLAGGILLAHKVPLNELEKDAQLHGHRILSEGRLWANLEIRAGPELKTGKRKAAGVVSVVALLVDIMVWETPWTDM